MPLATAKRRCSWMQGVYATLTERARASRYQEGIRRASGTMGLACAAFVISDGLICKPHRTRTCMQVIHGARALTHTRARAHKRARTHTHTHTYAHTHMHAHTCTHLYVCCVCVCVCVIQFTISDRQPSPLHLIQFTVSDR